MTGPGHLFNVYNHFERDRDNCSVEELISYLNLLHWDPYVVDSCLDLVLARIDQLSYAAVVELAEGMRRSARLFYYIPGSLSIFNNIGAFFQGIGDYKAAMDYYRLSIEQLGRQDFTSYNMGLCHFSLGDYDAALDAFREALALGYPESVLLKGWIVHTQEAIAAGYLACGGHGSENPEKR